MSLSRIAADFLQRLADAPAVLVRVQSVQGSTPRDVGTWMAVFADDLLGTIGGGHVEYTVMALAREMLQQGMARREERYALGPSLGQCCGGVMHLSLEAVDASDAERLRSQLNNPGLPLALFGAGHVGLALIRVFAELPYQVLWLDSRDQVFPDAVPDNVECEYCEPVHTAVAQLAPQSRVLIMSFSHAEDLDIVAACLRRQRAQRDLPYVGLIGSQTKWASFRKQLLARGFTEDEMAHITCPIGVPGIADKRPEVIAIAVAAQVLQVPA